MRIAFVTSSLEPGRDGVGDYTTLLAAESARRGHETVRLALNDPHLRSIEISKDCLRLPSSTPWRERVSKARHWLADFEPDFVSLQFVCYGFHPRGFVGHCLREALHGWPLHIFMHELWLGEQCGATLKDRIIGWLQRQCVLPLLRMAETRCVHTSNSTYVQLLGSRGISARKLPLFGHVPAPVPMPARTDGELTFIFFGTLHPIWPPEPLLSQLRELRRPVTLRHVGRIGAGAALWVWMEREYGGVFNFERLGHLPPEQIAASFASADFGVATTPWALIGKSGSIAAMLDCGLPVLVNRDEIRYPGLMNDSNEEPLLIRLGADLPAQLCSAMRRPPRLRLSEITDQFLTDWDAAAGR